MKIKKTKIAGLLIFKPQIYKDSRGFFLESYKENFYKKILGNQVKFCQDNISLSKKGVLRGIHFQFKKPQAQIMHLVHGKIFIAYIDFRPKSETFLKKFEIILDSSNNLQVFMPPGVGSGFQVLSNFMYMHYKVSEYYNPKTEASVIWNDKTLNINWPNGKKIISSKDKKNKQLKEINFKSFKDLHKLK